MKKILVFLLLSVIASCTNQHSSTLKTPGVEFSGKKILMIPLSLINGAIDPKDKLREAVYLDAIAANLSQFGNIRVEVAKKDQVIKKDSTFELAVGVSADYVGMAVFKESKGTVWIPSKESGSLYLGDHFGLGSFEKREGFSDTRFYQYGSLELWTTEPGSEAMVYFSDANDWSDGPDLNNKLQSIAEMISFQVLR